MSWFLLALVCVGTSSLSALFQKIAMRKEESSPIAAAIIFQFLLAFFSGLFAVVKGFHLPSISLLPYFLVSGMLYAVGTVAFFQSIKRIEASEMTVLSGSGVIFTILVSFIFLHERLNVLQLVGVVCILMAIILINYNKKAFQLNSGVLFALLGTATYGVAVVADTYIIQRYDALSFLPIASFIPGLFICIWYVRNMSHVLRHFTHIDKHLLIFSFLYAIQGAAFYLALQHGALVSQMSTLSRASIILTIILAAMFLKERKHILRKIFAAILTTAGVLLVA